MYDEIVSDDYNIDIELSNKQVIDIGDDINVEKYINIIENLYKISKKTTGNNFLLKYSQNYLKNKNVWVITHTKI